MNRNDDLSENLNFTAPELICNDFNSSVLDKISSQSNVNYIMFYKNMLLERIHFINMKRDKNYLLEMQSELCLLVRELSTLCTHTEKMNLLKCQQ